MSDTIVALATPPGVSGIAVIRVSGDGVFVIVDKHFEGKVRISEAKTHTIHYGKFTKDGNLIDFVTVSVFREPNSYTGENVVEISCHGGQIVVDKIIETLIQSGCRLAEPGEFTKRAFLNGKMDLTQVEAVADLIYSTSMVGYQTAIRQLAGEFKNRLEIFRRKLLDVCGLLELELDFAEEGFEFVEREKIATAIDETIQFCNELAESYKSAEITRSGFFVGIAGYPNSGKSTLFNALLQRQRAIVSEVPGTTRDYLEESIYLDGILVKLIDTAGLRDTTDVIEIEGIRMVESLLAQSNLILVINDASISFDHSDKLFYELRSRYPFAKFIKLQNKIDILGMSFRESDEEIFISAKTGVGLTELKRRLTLAAKQSTERLKDVLVNQRHYLLLQRASQELTAALDSLRSNLGNELVAIDIRKAVTTLGEITGESWNQEVLNNIFARFCIGK